MAHWRDVPTGSFAILGFGLWLAGVRYRSILLVLAAALSIGVSVGLRYNAFVLAAPAPALMVWRPFLERGAPRWAQALTGLAIVLSLGSAWASTQWRLPHLLKMPDPQNIAGPQLFDVIGTSACAGRNYLPAQVTRGRSLNAWHLRTAYDPRHLLITLQRKPSVPEILESDGGRRVGKVWRYLFLREPGSAAKGLTKTKAHVPYGNQRLPRVYLTVGPKGLGRVMHCAQRAP